VEGRRMFGIWEYLSFLTKMQRYPWGRDEIEGDFRRSTWRAEVILNV
jgi:hypothetical protein